MPLSYKNLYGEILNLYYQTKNQCEKGVYCPIPTMNTIIPTVAKD